MSTIEKTKITVAVRIKAPAEKVWNFWTRPEHIVQWNHASDDWHTAEARNDLRSGGRFSYRMEAKDGSSGFNFSGRYTRVNLLKKIEYILDDARKVQINFDSGTNETSVTEIFEAEQINTVELQKQGWQAILNNFKRYVENFEQLERLHFEITINKPVKDVYRIMFDQKKWEEWTAEFNPTSHFKGTWEKGSKMLFLGTNQNGSEGGMVSRIKEHIPRQFVSIEYLGVIHEGKEYTTGKEAEPWAGGLENYSFSEKDGKTRLSVDADTNREHKSYFITTWPKALNRLKSICENN